LFFQDCAVPADNVLGGVEGQGMYQLMEQLPYERAIIGVFSAAYAEQALALTVDYTRGRKAFGQSLFDFQNSRFVLADLATKVAVGRVFNDFIIAQRIAGTLDTTTASMTKLWSTETYSEVVDQCLQLFGGAGYMNEYPIARMYADARVMRIFGGASEIMKELISRAL
jgi:acyl-CoA dehydrogenase